MNRLAQEAFFKMMRSERQRQIEKWGDDQGSLEVMCLVLGEEVGEVHKAVLERDWENLIEELTQVAAVALKIFEMAADGKFAGDHKLNNFLPADQATGGSPLG